MGLQSQVFQAAVEIAMQSALPHEGSVSSVADRLAGSVRKPSGREYSNRDWASDFMSCLPAEPQSLQLLLMTYLPVYSCGCSLISLDAGRCSGCGQWRVAYRLTGTDARRAGGLSKSFWKTVQDRRLFARGLKIVEASE